MIDQVARRQIKQLQARVHSLEQQWKLYNLPPRTVSDPEDRDQSVDLFLVPPCGVAASYIPAFLLFGVGYCRRTGMLCRGSDTAF